MAIGKPGPLSVVEQMPAPLPGPGDIVILDSLSSHKVAGARDGFAVRGAEIHYLQPNSPDLNSIENAFSKLKTLLRKAAELTKDGLWDAIGSSLREFSSGECQNYIENACCTR